MKEHIEENLEPSVTTGRHMCGRALLQRGARPGVRDREFENTFGELFREFALNLCPAVCDSVRDKLRIRGFGLEGVGNATRKTVDAEERDAIRSHTREIWARGRMSRIAGEVHKKGTRNAVTRTPWSGQTVADMPSSRPTERRTWRCFMTMNSRDHHAGGKAVDACGQTAAA